MFQALDLALSQIRATNSLYGVRLTLFYIAFSVIVRNYHISLCIVSYFLA